MKTPNKCKGSSVANCAEAKKMKEQANAAIDPKLNKPVTNAQIKADVDLINPDSNSMDSRG